MEWVTMWETTGFPVGINQGCPERPQYSKDEARVGPRVAAVETG